MLLRGLRLLLLRRVDYAYVDCAYSHSLRKDEAGGDGQMFLHGYWVGDDQIHSLLASTVFGRGRPHTVYTQLRPALAPPTPGRRPHPGPSSAPNPGPTDPGPSSAPNIYARVLGRGRPNTLTAGLNEYTLLWTVYSVYTYTMLRPTGVAPPPPRRERPGAKAASAPANLSRAGSHRRPAYFTADRFSGGGRCEWKDAGALCPHPPQTQRTHCPSQTAPRGPAPPARRFEPSVCP